MGRAARVGLEVGMLDMGGRMLRPKPRIQLLSAMLHMCTPRLKTRLNMGETIFKVFLKWKGNLMRCNLFVYQMRLPDSRRVPLVVKIATFYN